MKRSLNYALFALVAIALTACANLGFTPPETAQQKLVYAASAITAANQQLVTAVDAGSISKEKGQELLTYSDAGRASVKAGLAAVAKGDTSGALKYLAAASDALAILQATFPAKK